MSDDAAPAALVWAPDGDRAALVADGLSYAGRGADVLPRVAALEAERHPRWVWWSAGDDARPLVREGIGVQRCWDLAEAHRLLRGGWAADPGMVWATVCRLPPDRVPRSTGDLFDFADDRSAPGAPSAPGGWSAPEGLGDLLRPDGYLRPEAVDRTWLSTGERLLAWGRAALTAAAAQHLLLAEVSNRAVSTAHSESAAALLCVELEESGLPLDRATAEQLITASAGPRPTSREHARAIAEDRDRAVLQRLGHRADQKADLRNPAHVRELLASAGIVVKDTRAWRLEPFRDSSPLVEALLQWRKAERIASTYGYAWLDAHVGTDGRLRGEWTACDGAAGRMTASNGLHNLPRPLRPAVAAAPGHVLVRADLGQIEPRVLAAVSGDPAFIRDTHADDLYAPVAARLGVERPRAKVAVLAAMYGQTSGAAGEALKGLQRAYPTAVGYLEAAYAEGVAGRALRTYGGRRVPTSGPGPGSVAQQDGAEGVAPEALAGRGRFARNAVVQGAAAELFKAWAATVRLRLTGTGAETVLCLHDELLVHAPVAAAQDTAMVLESSLTDAARRWTGSAQARFVADTRVVHRWSEAKD